MVLSLTREINTQSRDYKILKSIISDHEYDLLNGQKVPLQLMTREQILSIINAVNKMKLTHSGKESIIQKTDRAIAILEHYKEQYWKKTKPSPVGAVV